MPPPNVLWPEVYCFCPVRPCVRPETLLTRYLAIVFDIFTKLTSTMDCGTEMNASQVGVKKSKVKVMVE